MPGLSASIAGAAWMAETTVTVNRFQPGGYEIVGRSKTDPNFQISLFLFGMKTVGKYPLGTYPSVSGGYVQIFGAPAGDLISPTTGSAGEVTVTTLSTTRVAGTFSFTAVRESDATRVPVTNGTFDLALTDANPGAVADSAGGFFRGNVDGESFTAAAAFAYSSNAPLNRITVQAYNDSPTIKSTEISVLLQNITTTGTYALDLAALRYMSVKLHQRSRTIPAGGFSGTLLGSWHSQNSGSSGSVTITTLTASRIAGTLSAMIAPEPGSPITRSISVTASFDLGRRAE